MTLTFSLSSKISLSLGRSGASNGPTMADDFVNSIVRRLRQLRADVTRIDDKALLDEKIKKARASEEWGKLRQWMIKFRDDANREDGQHTFQLKETRNSIIEVAVNVPKHGDRILHAELNPDTYDINYHSEGNALPTPYGAFSAVVDGSQFHFADASGAPIYTEKMGAELINSLFGIPK